MSSWLTAKLESTLEGEHLRPSLEKQQEHTSGTSKVAMWVLRQTTLKKRTPWSRLSIPPEEVLEGGDADIKSHRADSIANKV